tara:strand:- start:344 stop:766 length:423 start_codon:yes stop_codon:yes gene_type:complete
MKIRAILIEDYQELIKWWKLHEKYGVVIPKSTLLPNKGLGGFVVEKDNKLIASAFLYLTNSAIGYVDYLIADPNYREDDRNDILIKLGTYVTKIAVKNGCERVMAMTSNKQLVKNMTKIAKDINIDVLEDDYKIIYTYDK